MPRQQNFKVIQLIRLNLFRLATGPIYNEFNLDFKGAQKKQVKGKLQFNLKMTQRIMLSILPQSVHVQMEHDHDDQAFNFSFKLVTNDKQTIESEHSKNYVNKAFATLMPVPPKEEDFDHNLMVETNKMNQLPKIKQSQTCFNRKGNDNPQLSKSPSLMMIEKSEKQQENKMEDTQNEIIKHPLKVDIETERILKNVSKQELYTQCQCVIEQQQLTKANRRQSAMVKVNNNNVCIDVETYIHQQNEKMRKRELVWLKQDIEFQELNVEMNSNEFSQTSFIFRLWSIAEKKGLTSSISASNLSLNELTQPNDYIQVQYIDNILVAESSVSLNKIYRDDFHAYDLNEDQDYIMSLQEKKMSNVLQFHGALLGKVTITLLMHNSPFLQQMIFGVNTEHGRQMGLRLYGNEKGKELKSKDVKNMVKERQLLEGILYKMCRPDEQTDQRSKQQEKALEALDRTIRLLKTTHKENSFSFLYTNQQELLISQDIMLDFSKDIMNKIDSMDEQIREKMYESIILIINRGEFDLTNMGFTNDYKVVLQQNTLRQRPKEGSLQKHIDQKIKVSLKYQNFIYNTLQHHILPQLTGQILSGTQRNFVQHFLVLAFFRIPEFQDELLIKFENLNDQEQLHFAEWTQYEFNSHNVSQKRNKRCKTNWIFDWNKEFYTFLQVHERGIKHIKELNASLQQPGWEQKFLRRGTAFLSFMTHWCKHVSSSIMIKENVPWEQLPGYNTLLFNVLVEFKKKDISQINDHLVDALYQLLHNEKLLSIYVSIIYNKTKVYDSLNVYKAYHLINQFLCKISLFKKNIPSHFNYTFFFKGIVRVLEKQEHCLCIAKILQVIYNHFNIFSDLFIKQLVDFLSFFCIGVLMQDSFFTTFQYTGFTTVIEIERLQHLIQVTSRLNCLFMKTSQIQTLALFSIKAYQQLFIYLFQNDYIHNMYIATLRIADQALSIYSKANIIIEKTKDKINNISNQMMKKFKEKQYKTHLKKIYESVIEKIQKLSNENQDDQIQKKLIMIRKNSSNEFCEDNPRLSGYSDKKAMNNNSNLLQQISAINSENLTNKIMDYNQTSKFQQDSTTNQNKVCTDKMSISSQLKIDLHQRNLDFNSQSPLLKMSIDSKDLFNNLEVIQIEENQKQQAPTKQKLIINRKKISQENSESSKLRLNLQQLKQLKRSCDEFELIKRQYMQNYLIHQSSNGSNNEMVIPTLNLKIPFDETETKSHNNDEW